MPLVWIYTLPEDSWQYTGNVPVLNRFLFPVPSEMLDNLRQFKLGCGYNVWMQIIRTSVLGEWDMADVGRSVKVLAVLLMLVGAAAGAGSMDGIYSRICRSGKTLRHRFCEPDFICGRLFCASAPVSEVCI